MWPYYTGHGLGETTMASFAPRQFRQMFVQGCEWAATGGGSALLGFDGTAVLLLKQGETDDGLQSYVYGKGRAALVRHPFDGAAAAGEIVGKNLLSLISTGSERGGFTQDFPADSYPMETGSSSIAQVLEVGRGGDRVCPPAICFITTGTTPGTFGCRRATPSPCPAAQSRKGSVWALCRGVDDLDLTYTKARAVDNIIVTGQGMVGVMCAAVLQAFGFEVYAVDPLVERRAAAREAGIRRVGESLAELGAAGEKLRCAHGVQRQRECPARRAVLTCEPRRARFFQIGVPGKKNSDWDAHSLLYGMFYAYVSIQGGWEWSIPLKSDEFHAHSSFEHIRTAMQLIADGRL